MGKEEMIEALADIREILVNKSNYYVSRNNNFEKLSKEELEKIKKRYMMVVGGDIAIGALGIMINAFIGASVAFAYAGLNYLSIKGFQKKYDENQEYYEQIKNNLDKVPYIREQISRLKKEEEIIQSFSSEELNNYLSYKMGSSNE